MRLLNSRRGVSAAIVLVMIVMSTPPRARAESQATPGTKVAILVNDSRPLEAAAEQLMRDHGWIINYEDPAYVDASEIVDMTSGFATPLGAPALRPKEGDPKRALIPAPRALQFDFVMPTNAAQQAATTLAALVHSYNGDAGADVYTLQQDGQVFSIVPTKMRGPDGRFAAYQSLLQTPISLPDGDRTALQMTMDVVKAVNDAGQTRLKMGVVTAGSLRTTHMYGGAAKETAQSVLTRAIRAAGPQKVRWQLLCSPGDGEPCFLSMTPVSSIPAKGGI